MLSLPTLCLCEELSDLLQQLQPTCCSAESSLPTASSREQKAATADVLWRRRALSRCCCFKHPSEKLASSLLLHSVFTLIFVLFSLILLLMCLCEHVVYHTSVLPVNLPEIYSFFPRLTWTEDQTEWKDFTNFLFDSHEKSWYDMNKMYFYYFYLSWRSTKQDVLCSETSGHPLSVFWWINQKMDPGAGDLTGSWQYQKQSNMEEHQGNRVQQTQQWLNKRLDLETN